MNLDTKAPGKIRLESKHSNTAYTVVFELEEDVSAADYFEAIRAFSRGVGFSDKIISDYFGS